jgi:hypothetical protein
MCMLQLKIKVMIQRTATVSSYSMYSNNRLSSIQKFCLEISMQNQAQKIFSHQETGNDHLHEISLVAAKVREAVLVSKRPI